MSNQEFDSPEEALRHFGVKGMKWGVRKDRETSGRKSGSSNLPTGKKSAEELEFEANTKKIQADLKSQGINSKSLQAKHAPESLTKEGFALTPGQKKALIIGGLSAVAVGTLVYKNRALAGSLEASTFAYSKSKDGLDLNWDQGVNLPKGSIVKRISSVRELEVRPGGFFGVFKDDDVETYKAVLPGFWNQWGVGNANKGGYVVNLKAKTAVKAPSGKETFDLFKKVVASNQDIENELTTYFGMSPKTLLSENDESGLKDLFKASSVLWANGTADSSSTTQALFKAAKDSGYNALIDFNDAGRLGNTPVRFLDGSVFEISKSDPLPPKEIYRAAKNFQTKRGADMSHMDSTELQHYGVKGMKWGVRRERTEGVSRSTDREARKDASEFARAKMFYGEGAGTRRKLIKNSVEAKAKRDPNYKKAFDKHLAEQDMSTHASKARKERGRKDARSKIGRGVRGTRHILNGNPQYASATTALLVGGFLYGQRTGINQVIANNLKVKYNEMRR